MRLSLKYEVYKKSWVISRRFPLKLIKFLRPKWRERYQKIQLLSNFSLVKTKKRSRRITKVRTRLAVKRTIPAFFDSVGPRKAAYFRWKKLKFNYKNQVQFKNKFYSFFDNSLRKSWLKKIFRLANLKKDVLSLFLNTVIKSCFRLDCLLTTAGFFKNVFQSRPFVAEGLVLVNSKKTTPNYIFKSGDAVSFLRNEKDSSFLSLVNSKKITLGSYSPISTSSFLLKLPLTFMGVSKIFNPILFYIEKFRFIRSRTLSSLYSSLKSGFCKNTSIKSTGFTPNLRYFYVSKNNLKKGLATQFMHNLSAFSVNRYFFTFLEVDPYTKNILVLKNYSELKTLDFAHIPMLSFNSTILKKFISFFRF